MVLTTARDCKVLALSSRCVSHYKSSGTRTAHLKAAECFDCLLSDEFIHLWEMSHNFLEFLRSCSDNGVKSQLARSLRDDTLPVAFFPLFLKKSVGNGERCNL